jgi:hypothetical protein
VTFAAAAEAASFTQNRWYELLIVFVSFNTVVYAVLAFAKLWPRRRR